MSAPAITATVADRVLFVTIRRAAKRNTLSRSALAGLQAAFDAHAADASLVGAVVTGEGDKAFAAGGDLHEFDAARDLEAAADLARTASDALDAVRRFPLPVIAAINGDALGGGAELAVACDLRIMAAHARIGFIQGKLAIPTGWGGGGDLRRILGGHAAFRLLIEARILDAGAALATGLVDEVAADGALAATLQAALARLRDRSPQVLRAFKAVTRPPRGAGEAEIEMNNFIECWLHADHWAAHDRIVRSLGTGRN